MNYLLIVGIAFCLAMDAFAIAFSCGMCTKQNHIKTALTAGLSFGSFQGFMPLIGWFIGCSFRCIIKPISHWVAFCFLCFIGISMILEKGEETCKVQLDSPRMILSLSFATSIDALATGVSFSALNTPVLLPALLIGIITFVTSLIGVLIGKKVRDCHFTNNITRLAGVFLILIGVKILLDHYLLL